MVNFMSFFVGRRTLAIDRLRKGAWIIYYLSYKVMNAYKYDHAICTEYFCLGIAITFFIFALLDWLVSKNDWVMLIVVFISGNNVYKELAETACEYDMQEVWFDGASIIVSAIVYGFIKPWWSNRLNK